MENPLDLKGKVAVISGAASGIGLSTGKLLAEYGAKVVLLDLNEEGVKRAEEIREEGYEARFIKCDVTSNENCKRAIEEVKNLYGRLDILFNNAGVTFRKTVVDLEESEWDLTINVALKGTYLLSKYSIPLMKKNGGGSIINTGSGWGLKGGDKAVAYCAAKGGVVNMTRAMAIDHGGDNIRVNSVNPGDTDTNMLRSEGEQLGFKSVIDDFLDDSGKDRPLARIGSPRDIANAVLFLSSDLANWITGAALVVDGGGIA